MAMRIHCPQCQTTLDVADAMASKRVRCPKCKHVFSARPATAKPVDDEPEERPKTKREKGGEFQAADKAPPSKAGSKPATSREPSPGSGGGAKLVIFGGLLAVVFIVVVAGATIGSYFMFFRDTGPVVPENPQPIAQKRDGDGVPDETKKLAGNESERKPGDSTEKKVPDEKKPRVIDEKRPKTPPVGRQPKEIALAGNASDVVIGGAGRFLLFPMPSEGKVAVFDAAKQSVVRLLPLTDGSRIAAGMDKLIILNPDRRVIERWDLATLAREAEAPVESAIGTAPNIIMGAASRGPLLLLTGEERGKFHFFDVDSLKPIDIVQKSKRQFLLGNCMVRASANGKVFGFWRTHVTPAGVHILTIDGKEYDIAYAHDSAGHIAPSTDGSTMYTAVGRYAKDTKKEDKAAKSGGSGFLIPAPQGDLFLSLTVTKQAGKGVKPADPVRGSATLHLGKSDRVLGTLDEITLPGNLTLDDKQHFAGDKRIILLPDHKLLVTVPTDDKLVLHPFDLDATLSKSGKDYLFVLSQPVGAVERGKTYTYQVQAKSDKGGLKYELESGPAGMSIHGDGTIQWQVGKDYAQPTAKVIVTVRNDDGAQARQAFEVTVTGQAAAGTQLVDTTKGRFAYSTAFGHAVMAPDHKTLIVSLPKLTSLAYIDTLANREIKTVSLKFQPDKLAIQNDWLFVSTAGSPTVRLLKLDTGEELKTITVPGEPIQSMAVHPKKNWIYVSDLTSRIFSINPHQGVVTKTKGWGQHLHIDTVDGKHVYAGTQKPTKEQIIVKELDDGTVRISFARLGQRAIMVKYQVDGNDLKAVASQDNAAINGRGMGLSADGKKVAMAGGGGWRSKTDPSANYCVAIFDASDLKTILGQIVTGPYPSDVAFHPVLPIGVAFRTGGKAELHLFDSNSIAPLQVIPVPDPEPRQTIVFGGQGTRLIFVGNEIGKGPGARDNATCVIHSFPLDLTGQDRAILSKVYAVQKP